MAICIYTRKVENPTEMWRNGLDNVGKLWKSARFVKASEDARP